MFCMQSTHFTSITLYKYNEPVRKRVARWCGELVVTRVSFFRLWGTRPAISRTAPTCIRIYSVASRVCTKRKDIASRCVKLYKFRARRSNATAILVCYTWRAQYDRSMDNNGPTLVCRLSYQFPVRPGADVCTPTSLQQALVIQAWSSAS